MAPADAQLRGLSQALALAVRRLRPEDDLSRRLAFLGPPGAGKGTQARELAREWSLPQIGTGDMLRAAVAAHTPLGREARRYMDAGALVPDDVIVRLVRARLEEGDAAQGFILDGFPRTIAQAEALDRILKDLGTALDVVVYIDVDEPELLRRLTGRRVCGVCQTSYHVVSAPPRRPGVCDKCDGQLYQREDDTEAAVRTRLEVYRRQTAPLLEYYRARGVLTRIDGQGPIETIRGAIRAAVAQR